MGGVDAAVVKGVALDREARSRGALKLAVAHLPALLPGMEDRRDDLVAAQLVGIERRSLLEPTGAVADLHLADVDPESVRAADPPHQPGTRGVRAPRPRVEADRLATAVDLPFEDVLQVDG